MRQFVIPVFAVLVGCAGGPGSAETTPTTTPNATPTSSNWADPLVGDGQIAGSGGDNAEYGGASDSAAVPSAGASSGATSSSGGSSSGSSGSSGSAGSSGSSGATSPPGAGGWEGSQPVGPGILTAGTWDDNRNFSFFSTYRTNELATGEDDGFLQLTDADTTAASTAFGGAQGGVTSKTNLDISLMIDTTGSMGDEIAYLQTEFTSLAKTIETKYPQAQQHWSLVLYKDKHDEYVVKWFDFRADTNEFQTKLMTASAGGGGDFPESPEQALGIAHRLSWRRDANVARLLFWVADAPHHQEDTATMTTAVKAARDKNIHIYPVASSGVDAFTEYTMRGAAQITGGRYIFLTDDSGVGDGHEVPTVPCFFVTKLNDAILRMVDVELTGAYREPTQSEILRTAGDPQGGVCQASGTTINIY